MGRALDLAWASFRAGSLGIGAVVTRHGEVVATGRNRLAEQDAGDDVLAGTSLAHAELNALAKLPWGTPRDGLELWTTLQPCVQCLGAIRMSPVGRAHVLAPDPIFRGVEGVRHVNPFLGERWPDIVESPVDEWSVLSLLLPTHVFVFWDFELPAWRAALPDVGALADELVASRELIALAADEPDVTAAAGALVPRLAACLPEVVALAAT